MRKIVARAYQFVSDTGILGKSVRTGAVLKIERHVDRIGRYSPIFAVPSRRASPTSIPFGSTTELAGAI